MQQQGLNLGGEQSGHVIFLDHNTTGDGVLTSLQLLKVLRKKGQPLSVLADQLQKYPQLLRNVKVANKEAWGRKCQDQRGHFLGRRTIGRPRPHLCPGFGNRAPHPGNGRGAGLRAGGKSGHGGR